MSRYRPANGLIRCKVCEQVREDHKHGTWTWLGYRWERNKGADRAIVVFYVVLSMLVYGALIGWVRAAVGL